MKHEKKEQHFQELESKDKEILILHNDEVNTFDFVIDNLVEICEHDLIQAEQCALITHHKGKCEIKKGEKSVLTSMKDLLIERGLSVTIES